MAAQLISAASYVATATPYNDVMTLMSGPESPLRDLVPLLNIPEQQRTNRQRQVINALILLGTAIIERRAEMATLSEPYPQWFVNILALRDMLTEIAVALPTIQNPWADPPPQ